MVFEVAYGHSGNFRTDPAVLSAVPPLPCAAARRFLSLKQGEQARALAHLELAES